MTLAFDPLADAYYAGDLDAIVAAAQSASDPGLAEAVDTGSLDAIVAYMEAHGGHYYGSRKALGAGGRSGGASSIPDKTPDPGSRKQLGGSTGAQLVKVDGVPYVDKLGASEAHIREEAAANAVYGVMGVPVPQTRLIQQPEGLTQRAEFIGGQTLASYMQTASPADQAAVIGKIRQGFATDALIANWDVAGLVGDNIIVRADGTPFRIDNGGSLRFRAQGGDKGANFGPKVSELARMTDASKGSWATDVFAGMDKGQIRSQVEALAAKRADILAVLPSEIRGTVSARIDDMLAQTSPVREAGAYVDLESAYFGGDVDALVAAAGELVAEAHGGHYYGSRKQLGGGSAGGGGGGDYGKDPLDRNETAMRSVEFTRQLDVVKSAAGWPDTKPWDASVEDIEAGKVDGLRAVHWGANRGGNDAVASVTSTGITGKIDVNVDAWKDLPREQRAQVLYHELGHLTTDSLLNDPANQQRLIDMGGVYAKGHVLGTAVTGPMTDANGEALASIFATRWTTPVKLEQDPTGTITIPSMPKARFVVDQLDSQYRALLDQEARFNGAPVGQQISLVKGKFSDEFREAALTDDRLVEALLDFGEAHAGHYFGSRKQLGKGGGGGGGGAAASGGDWNDPIPADVGAVITEYTDGEYIPINTYMRGGNYGSYPPSYASAESKAKQAAEAKAELEARGVPGEVAKMKSAVRPTEEPMTLYRGTHPDSFGLPYGASLQETLDHVQGLIGKDPLSDAAFMSTSVSDKNLFWGGSTVRMRITTPKGTPAINVGGLAKYPGEREVILDGGVRWRITSAQLMPPSTMFGMSSPAHVFIEAEVVP